MLVVMKRDATKEEIDAVVERIKEFGITPVPLPGAERTAIGTFGTTSRAAADAVESLPGVAEVVPISRPFKLASREVIGEDTVVRIGDVPVGHGHPLAVIAGPCAVESREVTLETARAVRAAGGAALRGGAFKPRTSPYAFRGMGGEGLEILAEARAVSGLPVVTEVLTPGDVEAVAAVADCLQIGARNMQNFSLLDAVGEQTKPVLLKRGMSATVEELLLSAEYILARGNRNVILCERGIRTFERYTRNTFDINAIPLLKRLSHLPVLADPSHGTGKWYLVAPIALAAVAAGADGLIVEVHPSPDHALSDGAQSLTFDQFDELAPRIAAVAHAVGRSLPAAWLGSMKTGRWLMPWMTGTELTSSVLRVDDSNVRMPRSQRMTSGFPWAMTYSAASNHSSISIDKPRLSITGLPALPTSSSNR